MSAGAACSRARGGGLVLAARFQASRRRLSDRRRRHAERMVSDRRVRSDRADGIVTIIAARAEMALALRDDRR
jgi:hypothetical protein